MDRAMELLNGMSKGEIAAYAASSLDNPHIYIDQDRIINVPEELKTIGVQRDHQVKRLVFDCPRYWDGIDFARTTDPKFTFYINYRGPAGQVSGQYTVDDVSVDETYSDIIHFSWPISNIVTQLSGSITFSVCCKENTDDEFVTRWNSEPCRNGLTVSEGLECMDAMFESYPAVMERVQRTSDRLDLSSEEVITNRLDHIDISQSDMRPVIEKNDRDIASESSTRSSEDNAIANALDAEAAARSEADAAISNRIDNIKIEVQERTYDELHQMVEESALPHAEFMPTDGTDERNSIKASHSGYLYRPYSHVYIRSRDTGMEGVKYYYDLANRELYGKCLMGTVTTYKDGRFYASFTMRVSPGANPASAPNLMEETQDIITREDLSRFIFGHNRACFSSVSGFWYPADATDGSYRSTYGDFSGGGVILYEPGYGKVPQVGAQLESTAEYSRANHWSFLPPRVTMTGKNTNHLYGSIMCERLGSGRNIRLTDLASKNLCLRFELTGTIDDENYFEPYSEYTPADVTSSGLIQVMKDVLTLNGVGNAVTLSNMYGTTNMEPSHSSTNSCDFHYTNKVIDGSLAYIYGDYCTHYLSAGAGTRNGKRAFLFENGALVAISAVDNQMLKFEWGTKTLYVAYSYTTTGIRPTTYFDYWRYENKDTSESTSQPLTVIFET